MFQIVNEKQLQKALTGQRKYIVRLEIDKFSRAFIEIDEWTKEKFNKW